MAEEGQTVQNAGEPTIEDLLQKTLILVSQQDYELALKFSERILEIQENNPDGLQFRSLCNLELGNPEAAYEDFYRLAHCGELEREVDAKLYLGQMADGGKDSLECFTNAFESISQLMQQQQNETGEIAVELKRKATATLFIESLFLTTLSFEPEAQEASLGYLNQALSIDNTDCDVHTNLASHSISSQQEPLQCLQHAINSYNCWKDLQISDNLFPSTDSMRSLSKVFVELGSLGEALEITKTALAVDDQDPETWYIAGWILFLEGEGQITPLEGSNHATPRPKEIAWPESKFALESCAKIYEQIEYDDQPLLEHVKELISILNNSSIEAKTFDDAEDDNEEGDGDEWLSDDEQGDMQIDN
ncbi:hypothetical protein E3Q10_02135 [Wallemia mellicola]|uniref:TPR-like protein n=1 Tax=Wallemia mellicola TaxID=1708541 RepID=A0A4V4MUK8_9BASI|nr:hypothetical protein E3Q10_02135 [Wallemia mellicola]